MCIICDISPSEFWKLTPYLTKLVIKAYYSKKEMQHNHDAWMMYHGALLSIPQKKPPKLEEFLVNHDSKKQVKGIDERDILIRFKAYKKQVAQHGTSS